ncbi:MAG: phage tail sheath C-terminal domain-containing protein [Deltaproteobacteria bacterium]
MLNYSTPGVYVEEISGGSRPIVAVGTSTAGFVGVAPEPRRRLDEAVRVNNWQHFKRLFCSESSTGTDLSRAVWGFFLNGGKNLYVVNVGAIDRLDAGLEALGRIDEIAIVAAPGATGAAAYESLLGHCERLEDRVAILDAPLDVPDLRALTEVATEGAPPADDDAEPVPAGGLRPRNSDRGFGAFYFPWVGVRDPLATTRQVVFTPPSGHVAGIYARSDGERGVHKAPANEGVRGALSLSYRVSREEQGILNDNGVNCIRFFTREGIRVWGGRTLAPAASEWRYINVRRLFNMIEESIAESTRWVVFEPNDQSLWKSIRRDVTAFLMRLWRDGALRGATPEQAFFVQCDEETNPPEVIDAGQVVTVIGLAPVKPAEFIIFRIGQTAAGAEVEDAGGEG